MDENDIKIELEKNKMQHEQFKDYLANDRKKLEKHDELIQELSRVSMTSVERIRQNEELAKKIVDKPNFWETKNGSRLFWILILVGIALVVASLGINLLDLSQLQSMAGGV